MTSRANSGTIAAPYVRDAVVNKLLSGIHYFLDGFSLLTKPGLKRFVIIPAFINMLIFIALFFLLRHYVGEFNAWFDQHVPHWLHWLSALIWVVFFVCFFIIFIYTFVTVGNIISAPFNSFLSEKIELHLTGQVPEARSLLDNIRDVPRILGRQFAILGFYVPRAIGLLILFFIPVVQAVAAVLWFIFNAWYLSLTYVDYPTDNHRVSIQSTRQWMSQNRVLMLGFGTAVLVCSMVPLLNFFVIPAAVAGATKLWLQEYKNQEKL